MAEPAPPPGYFFLRIVLIVGAVGFAVIGIFYLVSGQTVPGIFALVLAGVEAAALPLFRKLMEASRARIDGNRDPPP